MLPSSWHGKSASLVDIQVSLVKPASLTIWHHTDCPILAALAAQVWIRLVNDRSLHSDGSRQVRNL